MREAASTQSASLRRRAFEVFAAFLRLGLSAFGGPIAHIGYYQEVFVHRRKWLDNETFADLVALCQFLPGPASSQTAIGIGMIRAGPLGGLAAWVAFTLPSAILMTVIAFGAAGARGPMALGLIHGLKLVAVSVVAQAVLGMARQLTPDARRAGIALGAVVLITIAPASFGQIAAIGFGALAGMYLCRDAGPPPGVGHDFAVSKRIGVAAFGLYLILLVGGPILAAATGQLAIARFNAFYRSGALVFGGGHVVLPLLQRAVVTPGWIDQNSFLAGYGAAQAMPGPMFSFGAYLGAAMNSPPNGVGGAVLGLVGIFLPGVLALLAALPFWQQLRTQPSARAGMRGANAAVVGILAAALYNPLWTSAVLGAVDFTIALGGFIMLVVFKSPPWAVVGLGAAVGVARAYL
jgi:chromate transporter